MDETNDLQISLGLNNSDFNRGINDSERTLRGFESNVQRSMQNIGQSLSSFGATLTASVTLPIVGLATASIKAFGDIQALQKGLEAVAGSTQLANKQFNELKEVAKLPGLGLEEAVKGSINLQAIGIDANKSKNILLQFGNAVATVGKGRSEFERAIYGVQQLANTDFPLGEDLNIIKDALPQVSNLLKEAFGTSRSDELQKLGISSKQVLDVILTGLSELPRVSGGIKGAFENLSDSMKISLGRIGKVINDNFDISDIIDRITGFVDKLVTSFEGLNPTIQKVILITTGLVAAFGPLLLAVGGFITLIPTFKAGLTAIGSLFTFLISPIGLVTAAIIGVVAAVVANWDKIRPYLEETIDRFKRLYNESIIFRTVIGTLGYTLESVARVAVIAIKTIYENFKILGKGILEIFSSVGNVVEGVLTFDFDKVKKGLKDSVLAFGNTVTGVLASNTRSFSEMGGAIDKTAEKWASLRFDLSKKTNLAFNTSESIEKLKSDLVNAKVEVPVKIKITKEDEEPTKPVSFKFSDTMFDPLTKDLKATNDVLAAESSRTYQILNTQLPIAFTDSGKKVKEAIEAMELEKSIADLNKKLSEIVTQGVVNGISDSFASIGAAIAGGTNIIESVGKSLLSSFGKLLGELGKELIAYGVGMIAVKIAIKNPYLAIAAGAALVALGAGLSASVNKKVESSGFGGGGNVSTSTGASANTNYSSNFQSQGGSGNGEVVFRISGPDLIGTINRNVNANDRLTAI